MKPVALSSRLARARANKFNAFTFIRNEQDVVANVEQQQQSGTRFQGQLFGIKANLAVQGWPTDACSKMLENYKSPFSATVVERIEREGGVLLGLTNMDEFGMGSSGATSVHGATRNPWTRKDSQRELSPGGSSSGSAAAVAQGAVFCALGSDTGGSVRLPASHCGVVGFKPSKGLLSRYGLIAYANSLDCVGILAQKVDDVEQVLEVIAGPDGRDMTCRMQLPPSAPPAKKIRIGLCSDFNFPEMHPSVLQSWQRASELLAETNEADSVEFVNDEGNASLHFPSLSEALPAYYVIALAEASSNLARYDGVRYGHRTKREGLELRQEYAASRSEGFGQEVQRRLLMGSLALTRRNAGDDDTCFYSMATRVRQRLEDEFENCFAHCDVLLLPTAPWTGADTGDDASNNPVRAFLQDTLTVPASLAGLPAISVPCSLCPETGAPIGMQIIGALGQDRLVLHVAKLLERAVNFPTPAR